MAVMSLAQRTRILADIARKTAQLELANSTYETLVAQDFHEYKLDTSEGSQRVVKRKLKELQDQIEWLESAINLQERRLRSGAIVNLDLRRIQR